MIFSTDTNRSTSVLGCWDDPPAAALCSDAFCCLHNHTANKRGKQVKTHWFVRHIVIEPIMCWMLLYTVINWCLKMNVQSCWPSVSYTTEYIIWHCYINEWLPWCVQWLPVLAACGQLSTAAHQRQAEWSRGSAHGTALLLSKLQATKSQMCCSPPFHRPIYPQSRDWRSMHNVPLETCHFGDDFLQVVNQQCWITEGSWSDIQIVLNLTRLTS